MQRVKGSDNVVSGRDITVVYQAGSGPRPEYLWKVIDALAKKLDEEPSARSLHPFDIDEKIQFNRIARFEQHIKDNSEAHWLVEDAYKNAEAAAGTRVRSAIYRFLRNEVSFLKAKTPAATGDDVLERILEKVRDMIGTPESVPAEDVLPCCDMIVVHAFTACVFLRAPCDAR